MKVFSMHSDVNVAKFLIVGFVLIAACTRTSQDGIGENWNNQLPTNSVYPGGTRVQGSSGDMTLQPDEGASFEETLRDTASEEVDYDDEYEESGHRQSKDIREMRNQRNSSHEINSKTKEKNPRDSADYSYYYYYDDDYDNATNSHLPDHPDPSVPESASGAPPLNSPLPAARPQETLEAPSDPQNTDDRILIGEAIVSVVTTKSVVNGTISIPTPSPMTTEQMDAPLLDSSFPTPPSPSTTEDSIIVASVQTSRSISGARFLPFDLNGDLPRSANTSEGTRKSIESTESIIDKLDRVQSELSSGFLTGGFRTAGNALQLDVLSEQRPTPPRKSFTTTGKPPVISKFVPKRYNERKGPTSTETEGNPEGTLEGTTPGGIPEVIQGTNVPSRSKGTFKWPSSSRSKASTTESPRVPKIFPRIKADVQDISAFLPPGFKLKKEEENTEKSIISDILARSKINVSSLLPANYEPTEGPPPSSTESSGGSIQDLFSKSNVDISAFLPAGYNKEIKSEKREREKEEKRTTTASPIQKTLQELFSKSAPDISALLPVGYDKEKNATREIGTTEGTTEGTTKPSGGVKLVFPSRPGGRKAVQKAATPMSRANEAPTAVTPKIQKGWPTRATTEFTGWPTPSTTPISIEKLLEAARTATISSINSSIIPITSEASTTPSTTTTTTTVRPTTPGYCTEECEVAGTIRIIGNATWVPELFDRNTREWQDLANVVEKEINLVYIKSAILRKWYKNVRIDAFSPGSILVDYFVELQDLTQRINTQELRVLFHDSLRTYNAHKWNESRTTKAPLRLGEFLIDPKSTDFVVIPRVSLPQHIERDDRLIPQWAIAVIVIGVGGLVFIIIFGVSVLVNRQNTAKLRPSVSGMYTEEAAKNIIQASQAATSHRSSQDYPKSEISTIWNETDAWREKSFESNSNKDEKKYNVYDSWRSEWNGYYYQPSQSSSKFQGYESSAYSHHPPDYDTNF